MSISVCRETLRQLLSAFRAIGRFSVNFLQHSVRPEHISLICHEISVLPEDLPSTLYEARRTSVNLCQHSVPSGDTSSTFVKFPCSQKTFRRHSTKLCEFPSFSVNFSCSRKTFRQLAHGKFTEVDRTSLVGTEI